MKCTQVLLALAAAAAAAGHAHASEPANTLAIGYAAIGFNVKSGPLSGPPGTTPPGVTVGIDNSATLAVVYTRQLDADWSVSVAMGTPPVLKFRGEGSAAPLGEVGSARAWFPAATVNYSLGRIGPARAFAGVGVNYMTYTDAKVYPSYTSAFAGTSSSAKIKDSFGPVVRLGVELPLRKDLALELSYARYWIKSSAEVTTQTPGLGPVTRTLRLRSDPDAFAIMLAYRF